MAAQNSTGEYFHWDPAAAVIMNNPHLCQIIHKRLDVVVDTGTRGKYFGQPEHSFPKLRWDSEPRNFLDDYKAGALVPATIVRRGNPLSNNVDVCTNISIDLFESIYLKTLN